VAWGFRGAPIPDAVSRHRPEPRRRKICLTVRRSPLPHQQTNRAWSVYPQGGKNRSLSPSFGSFSPGLCPGDSSSEENLPVRRVDPPWAPHSAPYKEYCQSKRNEQIMTLLPVGSIPLQTSLLAALPRNRILTETGGSGAGGGCPRNFGGSAPLPLAPFGGDSRFFI